MKLRKNQILNKRSAGNAALLFCWRVLYLEFGAAIGLAFKVLHMLAPALPPVVTRWLRHAVNARKILRAA
ncbi:MAG: hypothetical protein C5B44_01555 [Acidobacteria bacterium]|nr:MAG: hypothetical protein C5B44_01555 [Acidobacteriota bacterium]